MGGFVLLALRPPSTAWAGRQVLVGMIEVFPDSELGAVGAGPRGVPALGAVGAGPASHDKQQSLWLF